MTVALVGAGPGACDLITVRGLDLLRACDVVVYDRLVSPELVAEAPPHARRVAREGLRQETVNALLVRMGRAGLRVVRLKGGDPFVFGRGGEEALALARAGVEYEVVPGVSALASVPGAAGIPVTHRGVAAQVTLVSAQREDGSDLDWAGLARTPGTLVVFMGLAALPRLASELVAHGRDPETPAAVVSHGTLPDQRTVTAPLARIADAAAELESPALVVIGEVVSLAAALALAHAAAA
jgi:uroporphyrin-III C-methyltransferase